MRGLHWTSVASQLQGWGGGLCKQSIFYMGRQQNYLYYICIPQDQRDVLMFYKLGFKWV